MAVAYETATIAKWRQIRPHEDTTLISRLMEQDRNIAVMIQIAFEAGRDWQARHPAASVDFPDYDAQEVSG